MKLKGKVSIFTGARRSGSCYRRSGKKRNGLAVAEDESLGRQALAVEVDIEANVPLNQPQTESDIAQCVVYLCKADNLSGTAITIDGGHSKA